MPQFHDDLKSKMDEVETYLSKPQYDKLVKLAEDIGAMLWGILRKL